MKKNVLAQDVKIIKPLLENLPVRWDAKGAILEMKNDNYGQWRQMEWIGFYFQYLCEKALGGVIKIQQPKYGRTSFDGLLSYPWDFKVHPINTERHDLITNDREATEKAIKDYGATGLILALGNVVYNDETRTFQKWHEEIKGGKSKYEVERIQRGAWSRLRKTSFDLKQILFIRIDNETLKKTGSFQEDFRNSNGKPRRAKVLLRLDNLDTEIIDSIDWPRMTK
jgi:hypothetical protein